MIKYGFPRKPNSSFLPINAASMSIRFDEKFVTSTVNSLVLISSNFR